MNYVEITINVQNIEQDKEILISFFNEIGFESYVEEEDKLLAYINIKDYDEEKLLELQNLDNLNFDFEKKIIEDQNWNAVWESNFEAVEIAGKCYVRAPFHKKNNDIPYEIIIEPKMAFGTAHHETTSLIIEMMFDMDFEKKSVLDMGCGTGILAILASKLGSTEILAIDNDEWAYNNTIENCEKNNILNIGVKLGDAGLIKSQTFDIIIANINRNVLLNDLKNYVTCLNSNGKIILSGFYERDVDSIKNCAEKLNLNYEKKIVKNNWCSLLFNMG